MMAIHAEDYSDEDVRQAGDTILRLREENRLLRKALKDCISVIRASDCKCEDGECNQAVEKARAALQSRDGGGTSGEGKAEVPRTVQRNAVNHPAAANSAPAEGECHKCLHPLSGHYPDGPNWWRCDFGDDCFCITVDADFPPSVDCSGSGPKGGG